MGIRKRAILTPAIMAFLLGVVFQLTLLAQPQSPAPDVEQSSVEPTRIEAPFLWVIEGDTPQYLLGTIHVPDKRVLSLHPAIDRALSKAERLYVELNPQDQLSQLQVLILPEGKLTSETLAPKTLERIDARLAAINPNWSHKVLPSFRTWAWPLILPSFMAQQRDPTSPVMDAKLIQVAEERKLPVESLENPKNQLKGFEALSQEEQILFLKLTLDNLEQESRAGESSLDRLINVYLKGDRESLQTLFMEEFENEEASKALNDKIMKAILFQRNEAMAQVIDAALQKAPDTTHLFAAGTAHFVVGPSVIDHLRRAGYKISRVTP
jgi:uncharacterized protein YbaP (TraB family)